jgi:hypothetical protein
MRCVSRNLMSESLHLKGLVLKAINEIVSLVILCPRPPDAHTSTAQLHQPSAYGRSERAARERPGTEGGPKICVGEMYVAIQINNAYSPL